MSVVSGMRVWAKPPLIPPIRRGIIIKSFDSSRIVGYILEQRLVKYDRGWWFILSSIFTFMVAGFVNFEGKIFG